MTSYNRRTILKASAAFAGASAIGFPAISYGQTDKIKIGHLTPLTGFLGALGAYAQLGMRMAEEEINKAGGVMGRQLDVMSEDSVNPGHGGDQGPAHARAGRRDRADGRDQFGLGADHHAGGGAQQEAVHADRRALRRAARQELQQVHVPRRHPEHRDGQRRRQGAAARQHGEGQEVLHADRRLYFRPRSARARPSASSPPTRQPDRRRTDRDRRHRLQPLSAEDPAGQARRGLLKPRRQSGHRPDQAICRIRPALSDRRLQPQHRRRLGGR